MNTSLKIFSLACLAILVALPALARPGGFVVGAPTASQEFAACNTNGPFTFPSDGASLFAIASDEQANSGSRAPVVPSLQANLYQTDIGCSYSNAAPASWNCSLANFPNRTPDDIIYSFLTVYPSFPPDGSHEGWMMFHNNIGTDDASRPNLLQQLTFPTATAAVAIGGNPASDPTSGFDVTFDYPVEFDDEQPGGANAFDPCYVGGSVTPAGFDTRLWAGFNVYMLPVAEIDPAASDPVDYLCGPDRDCATAGDNGWQAFIPLDGSGGPTIDTPTVDCLEADCTNGVDDDGDTTVDERSTVGVEQRASGFPGGGTTSIDVIYSLLAPGSTEALAFAIQPVARVANTGPLSTWNGMLSLDVDGDTLPEFVDPSGTGLGLTANGAAPPSGNGAGATLDVPWIFLSTDAVADGANPTPVEGSVELQGVLGRRAGVIELAFLSSIQADVVSYDLFRSHDGETYVQVNDRPIDAVGTPFSTYTYTDTVDVRRLRTDELLYKVAAELADGTTSTFGPFQVVVEIPTRRSPVRRR